MGPWFQLVFCLGIYGSLIKVCFFLAYSFMRSFSRHCPEAGSGSRGSIPNFKKQSLVWEPCPIDFFLNELLTL